MFFGKTSSAISGGSFWRRTRLRRATATARLAAFCPYDVFVEFQHDLAWRHVVKRREKFLPSTGSAPFPPGA